MRKMNLRCYVLVRKSHEYINLCPLLLVRDILSIRIEYPEREFYCRGDQEFFQRWKPEVLKKLDPHRYSQEVDEIDVKMKTNKVASPKEFFQLSQKPK